MSATSQSEVELLVRARLEELTTQSAPWNRRCWDLGTALALDEAHEASTWVSRRVLSESSLSWFLRRSLQPRLGQDVALGDSVVRQQLENTLKSGLTKHANQRTLAELTKLVRNDYLARWRDHIAKMARDRPGELDVERTSRYLAGHLLDGGFHMDNLSKIIPAALAATPTLADLVDYLNDLDQLGMREYRIIIPLQDVPVPEAAAKSDSWIPPNELRLIIAPLYAVIRRLMPPVPLALLSESRAGGLRFVVTARDRESAADEAWDILARLAKRVKYIRGSEQELTAFPIAVFDDDSIALLELPSHRASLETLRSENLLYKFSSDAQGKLSQLEEALELAAALNEGSASTAIAGGWAALESLLSEGEDTGDRDAGRGARAADRAAALVTTLWPRAELATLSRNASVLDPRLARRLDAHPNDDRERCRIVTEWLRSGHTIEYKDPSDIAALYRMQQLIDAPKQVVGRVNGYMCGALRRLYRQRNIVLHGGSIQSVALRATLRTTAPLVGAALDSIAYGCFRNDQSPLESAARSQLALKLVGETDGWDLHELNRAKG